MNTVTLITFHTSNHSYPSLLCTAAVLATPFSTAPAVSADVPFSKRFLPSALILASVSTKSSALF